MGYSSGFMICGFEFRLFLFIGWALKFRGSFLECTVQSVRWRIPSCVRAHVSVEAIVVRTWDGGYWLIISTKV